jgi:hypothetical protein
MDPACGNPGEQYYLDLGGNIRKVSTLDGTAVCRNGCELFWWNSTFFKIMIYHRGHHCKGIQVVCPGSVKLHKTSS